MTRPDAAGYILPIHTAAPATVRSRVLFFFAHITARPFPKNFYGHRQQGRLGPLLHRFYGRSSVLAPIELPLITPVNMRFLPDPNSDFGCWCSADNGIGSECRRPAGLKDSPKIFDSPALPSY